MLTRLFGSRLRAKALGWLMTHPDERFFVRQLTSILGEDSTNLSRELARLSRMGILAGRQEGRQKYYQVNPRCPIFKELRALAVKTFGLGEALRVALKPLSDRIRAAFLFGSFARSEETSESDIDLLLVGDLTLREASAILGPVGRSLGREFNPTVYSPQEFRAKVRNGHHFLTEVVRGEKMYLIGDDDELKRLLG